MPPAVFSFSGLFSLFRVFVIPWQYLACLIWQVLSGVFKTVYIKKSYHLQRGEISILMPFIYSFIHCFTPSCLIGLAWTSSTMLCRNVHSGHPCLISGLRRKAFNHLPLSVVLDAGMFSRPLLCWGKFLLPHLLRVLIMIASWICPKLLVHLLRGFYDFLHFILLM